MAVSPDGKHMATASKDGIARVFDLSTAQLSGGFKVAHVQAVLSAGPAVLEVFCLVHVRVDIVPCRDVTWRAVP